MQPGGPQAASPPDLVTALQGQLVELASQLFNFFGALQRDARPVSLAGEGQAGGADPQVKALAGQLVQGVARLEELLGALPEGASQGGEQVQRIAELQADGERLEASLKAALARAAAEKRRLQAEYDAAADASLKRG